MGPIESWDSKVENFLLSGDIEAAEKHINACRKELVENDIFTSSEEEKIRVELKVAENSIKESNGAREAAARIKENLEALENG